MTSPGNKPRLCLAFPGLNYLPYSPRALSTLPLLPFLQECFDVTLMFRSLLDDTGLDAQRVLTLVPPGALSATEHTQHQHSYYQPKGLEAWRYIRGDLAAFASTHAREFDLVVEREWSHLGALARAFRRHGVPTIVFPVAEFASRARPLRAGWRTPRREMLRRTGEWLTPYLRRRWMRAAAAIVTETDQGVAQLGRQSGQRGTASIHAIAPGVAVDRFHPADRRQSRAELGIAPDEISLVYVGSLNRSIQEPGPMIEALGLEQTPGVHLHVVGEGIRRAELAALADRCAARITFHGHVPQCRVATFIAAADLCVAPYNSALFRNGDMTMGSLKIPEYLACGRPVLATDAQRTRHLLDAGRYGYLCANTVDAYRQFFRHFPAAAELAAKEARLQADLVAGELQRRNIVTPWRDVAQRHMALMRQVLATAREQRQATG